ELARQGRYKEARQEFRRAVEIDPENAMAWANLGMASAASGSEQEAVESYSKALRLDPGNWLAHYNLGLLQARRGNPEEALRHLEQAFAAQPDPASPERLAMIADLRSSAPAGLRKEPRFAALVGKSGGRE
ncbi:MAG TPA: tetratricopeptide repeat protein, partial [Gemmatimonadales bacterium]|nr:tetratricopeptide repeat protein [Gemmatimonadales bacterium]